MGVYNFIHIVFRLDDCLYYVRQAKPKRKPETQIETLPYQNKIKRRIYSQRDSN